MGVVHATELPCGTIIADIALKTGWGERRGRSPFAARTFFAWRLLTFAKLFVRTFVQDVCVVDLIVRPVPWKGTRMLPKLKPTPFTIQIQIQVQIPQKRGG